MNVKESIKKHEGFRNKVYKDTLGKRTIGYGHLCVEDWWEDDKEYPDAQLDRVFEQDFAKAEEAANRLCKDNGCEGIPQEAKNIISKIVSELEENLHELTSTVSEYFNHKSSDEEE